MTCAIMMSIHDNEHNDVMQIHVILCTTRVDFVLFPQKEDLFSIINNGGIATDSASQSLSSLVSGIL